MNRIISTGEELERAFLVCTTIPKSGTVKTYKQKIYKEHLEELEFLAKTAGAEVIDKFYQERDTIDSSHFIGKGKTEEIAQKAEEQDIDLVVFENSLTPTQIRNLERIIKCKVIDKPALILDIFASNARTAESKTQVELAQLQYLLPRLTRQWTHLSKQYGGIGTKGPGETQIETDRRLVKTRISVLKEKLKKIEEQRRTQRQQRSHFIRLTLVGYTNVGKSTLLNVLTHAGVLVEDKLFATLDTSTRVLKEINHKKFTQQLLISDTVGFIRNLPHDLIESFKSTLAEVVESDILLHVIDISSDYFEDQIKVVEETLTELSSMNKPVIKVFNKVDILPDDRMNEVIGHLKIKYPGSVFISASKGLNLNKLDEKILQIIDEQLLETEIKIPMENNSFKLINQIHKNVEVIETKYYSKSIKLKLRGNKSNLEKISKTLLSHKGSERKREVQ